MVNDQRKARFEVRTFDTPFGKIRVPVIVRKRSPQSQERLKALWKAAVRSPKTPPALKAALRKKLNGGH